jgi:thioredoxin reductase (NADPH)
MGLSLSLNLGSLEDADEASRENGTTERDLIVVGGGPAGLTAGLYAGRAQLKPLVIMGDSFGGQAATTSDMENYPGFPEGIGGMALAEQMAEQAKRFGAEIEFDQVTAVDLSAWPFQVKTFGRPYKAKTLILATGARARRLGVPGEDQFWGRGVSVCATCDGYFYKDKTVVVVGGGDSALDEGLYLTKFAKEVIIVHRRDELRAGPIFQERAFANEKIRFVWDSVVTEILGDTGVNGVLVHNLKTGEQSLIDCDGVFLYVGMIPNTELFEGQIALDDEGYIVTDKRQRTSVPGVFAAGDVQDPWFRQVVIAAGAGAAAAIEAERWLAEKEFEISEREAEEA